MEFLLSIPKKCYRTDCNTIVNHATECGVACCLKHYTDHRYIYCQPCSCPINPFPPSYEDSMRIILTRMMKCFANDCDTHVNKATSCGIASCPTHYDDHRYAYCRSCECPQIIPQTN